MALDFLKSLLGQSDDAENPNEKIDNIKRQIEANKNDIQAPWEMKANDSLLRQELADAQPYPLAPMDLLGDKFNALGGVLPGTSPVPPMQPGTMLANSPLDPNINLAKPESMSTPSTPRMPASPTVKKPAVAAPAPAPVPAVPPVQAATPVEAPKAPAPAEPDAYDKMLADKREQMNFLNMMEAADRIGTAIAGQGHLKFENGKYDNLRKQAEAKADDFIKGQKFKQDQTKFGLDTEKAKLDIEKAKSQMDDEKAKRDANSDISKVNRASVIDSLNRIGRKDLAAQVTPNMSSKQLEDIFGQYNLQNMVSNFEAQQNRLEMAKLRAGEKKDAQKEKMDAQDTKRLDQANKMITASIASSRGAFGKSANILRSAEAIETLVQQQPLGQMDNRQIQELARSLDAMLSQGAATITGTAHLVPRSMSGDAAKIQEYITNIPKGAGQAKFVKRMVETIEREKELAKKQISRESRKILSSYADLAKKNPEAWNLMLQQHDLPADVFNLDNEKETSNHQFNVDQDALAKEMKKRGL